MLACTHPAFGGPMVLFQNVIKIIIEEYKVETGSPAVNAPQSKSATQRSGLFLCPKNRVLCRLADSEFDDGLGGDLDLLLRLWIEAYPPLPLLLCELTKAGHDEFAVLFNLFGCERAERLEEYSSGSFVGLGGSSECDLKFGLGHV
jgi:hypothetical protein